MSFLVPHLIGRDDPTVADGHSTHFAALRGEGPRPARWRRDLVRRCASTGLRVVLATSGKSADLDWMLPTIGAAESIYGSTTSEDVDATKPAPDVLLTAVQAYGLDPARTVTVGDSVWGRAGPQVPPGSRSSVCSAAGSPSPSCATRGAVAAYSDPADLVAHFVDSPLTRSTQ